MPYTSFATRYPLGNNEPFIASLLELRLAIKEREQYNRSLVEDDEQRSINSLWHHFNRLNTILQARYRLELGVGIGGWGPSEFTPQSSNRRYFTERRDPISISYFDRKGINRSPPLHGDDERVSPSRYLDTYSMRSCRQIVSPPRDTPSVSTSFATLRQAEESDRTVVGQTYVDGFYQLINYFITEVLPFARTSEHLRRKVLDQEAKGRQLLLEEEQCQVQAIQDVEATAKHLLTQCYQLLNL